LNALAGYFSFGGLLGSAMDAIARVAADACNIAQPGYPKGVIDNPGNFNPPAPLTFSLQMN
jgi:hypothetical protein